MHTAGCWMVNQHIHTLLLAYWVTYCYYLVTESLPTNISVFCLLLPSNLSRWEYKWKFNILDNHTNQSLNQQSSLFSKSLNMFMHLSCLYSNVSVLVLFCLSSSLTRDIDLLMTLFTSSDGHRKIYSPKKMRNFIWRFEHSQWTLVHSIFVLVIDIIFSETINVDLSKAHELM